MKLLISGANGFLGQYVVTEAIRRGHFVRALVRPASDVAKLDWYARDRIEVMRADLRVRRGLSDVVRGVDCVLHLAAAKCGDLYTQLGATVVATENLLNAMTEAGVHKIVLISSLSVYDYRRMHCWSRLTEDSPLEKDAFDRDEYAQAKLMQERLVRDYAASQGWDCAILRPGVIWGKDNLFTARLGMQAGPRLWIRTGAWARLPLTYVENCAQAVVMAAESKQAIGKVLNVIDDQMPNQRRFVRMIRNRVRPKPRIIAVPFSLLRAISGLVWSVNQRVFAGRAKIPGLLVPARLDARCKPLRFSNHLVKQTLGWKPRYSLKEALDRVAPSKGTAARIAASELPAPPSAEAVAT